MQSVDAEAEGSKAAGQTPSEVPKFRQNYRKSSCLSKVFFFFASDLINSVKSNENVMKEEHIEDMTLREGETDKYA